MRRLFPPPALPALLLGGALAVAACKAPQAYGDRNSIIIRVDTAVWRAHETLIEDALEPRIFTVRPERTFHVTPVHPWQPQWAQLRQWQQVLVLDTLGDSVVDFLLRKAKASSEPWTRAQVADVWARGQTVTVMALPREVDRERLRAEMEQIHGVLDRQFRAWARNRMFASGVNDSLAGALEARGFHLTLPNVYGHAIQDSFFLFRNAYPDPSRLLRSILLTWLRDGAALPAPEQLRDWRDQIAERFYQPPQDLDAEGRRFDTVTVQGRPALEMRGVWRDRSDYPAAGLFIARAVACPRQSRTYYMDAYLYAPGRDDKYQYVLQLETLLDSFRCLEG